MAKKQAALRLGKKMREVKIPRTRNITPMHASRDAVNKAADVLTGIGMTREFALEMVATQLHENLVAIKTQWDGRMTRKGGK